jgi:hypothetical protein
MLRRIASNRATSTMTSMTSRYLVWAAAALLLTQGVYGLVMCWSESNWWRFLFCLATIAAGVGLVYQRWWSRPLTVAIVALLLVPGIKVLHGVISGGVFRGHQFVDMCWMLLPLVGYLGLAIFCAFVAVRYVPGWPWARRT